MVSYFVIVSAFLKLILVHFSVAFSKLSPWKLVFINNCADFLYMLKQMKHSLFSGPLNEYEEKAGEKSDLILKGHCSQKSAF